MGVEQALNMGGSLARGQHRAEPAVASPYTLCQPLCL